MAQTHLEQQLAVFADSMTSRYFIVMNELRKLWFTHSAHKLNTPWTNTHSQLVSVSSNIDLLAQCYKITSQ